MSEEKGKRVQKRTTKISYRRCTICGARKKEQDMYGLHDICKPCVEKQHKNLETGDGKSHWRDKMNITDKCMNKYASDKN